MVLMSRFVLAVLGPTTGVVRHAVDHGERTLLAVLHEELLLLDAGAIHDVRRWITPVGPPRRFAGR